MKATKWYNTCIHTLTLCSLQYFLSFPLTAYYFTISLAAHTRILYTYEHDILTHSHAPNKNEGNIHNYTYLASPAAVLLTQLVLSSSTYAGYVFYQVVALYSLCAQSQRAQRQHISTPFYKNQYTTNVQFM